MWRGNIVALTNANFTKITTNFLHDTESPLIRSFFPLLSFLIRTNRSLERFSNFSDVSLALSRPSNCSSCGFRSQFFQFL